MHLVSGRCRRSGRRPRFRAVPFWLLVAGLFGSLAAADEPSGSNAPAGPGNFHAESRRDTATVAGGDVRVLRDQRYGEGSDSQGSCDVYLPVGDRPSAGWPGVIVLHGGGWTMGDKWTTRSYARALAQHGFVAININYRLAPTHQFPAQVDDVREALVWTAAQADRFAVDLSRLGLFGYSAGGHLSVLVGLLADEPIAVQRAASGWADDDPRWEQIPAIRAVCAGGPPCDFRDLPPSNTTLAYFLGGSRAEKPEVYRNASPTAHTSAGDPPVQIIHGEADALVPAAASRALAAALLTHGVSCRYELIPRQGHLLTFLHPKTQSTMLQFFLDMLKDDGR